MKIIRVNIISAETCGGLLDGLDLVIRSPLNQEIEFSPTCLIGQNGAGKSQFLQVLAEIFQSAYHGCSTTEERIESNADLEFEMEYLIRPKLSELFEHVKISRRKEKKGRAKLKIQKVSDGGWLDCKLDNETTDSLLPSRVIGYSSGDNETLSLPFLISRSGYADEVTTTALAVSVAERERSIPDTRLMLIDYETHLEVLIANLILGTDEQKKSLLSDARLKEIKAFRCIIQLAHSAAPKDGIKLTPELKTYIDQLKRCATCFAHDEKKDTYILDYWINAETIKAFKMFWTDPVSLYTSFRKLSMLNDLAIPKKTRDRFRRETKARNFASRLPEPQEEDKAFRFESVNFVPIKKDGSVDYVSLSDGEHQLNQILGTFCMLSGPNVLFLLDEPESHFNPQWRVKFISRLLDLPTENGKRGDKDPVSQQECFLTTHAPFVPSDMSRERVLIFSRAEDEHTINVTRPQIETFGTEFDTILDECFGVRPPISQVSRDEIEELRKSTDALEIQQGIQRLGDTVEKAFLADHLREILKEEDA